MRLWASFAHCHPPPRRLPRSDTLPGNYGGSTKCTNLPWIYRDVTGPDHRFVFLEQGLSPAGRADDVIGKTVSEVLPEVVSQGFVAILDRVYETGVPFIGRGCRSKCSPIRNHRRKSVSSTRSTTPFAMMRGAIVGCSRRPRRHQASRNPKLCEQAAGSTAARLKSDGDGFLRKRRSARDQPATGRRGHYLGVARNLAGAWIIVISSRQFQALQCDHESRR